MIEERLTRPRSWWIAAGVIALLFVPIVMSARFPPITDLPQHLAQIRLLDELLGLAPKVTRPDTYLINWSAPNNLVYAPMWLLSRVLPPVALGKATIWLLLCGWLWATLRIARQRGRALPQALMASVFLFNFVVYWGFLNFLIGLPLFLLWLEQVGPDAALPRAPRKLLGLTLLAFLLYEAHALWFAFSALWLGLSTLWAVIRRRAQASSLGFAALILLPTIAMAARWYPRLSHARAAAGFEVAARWTLMPWERLRPGAIVDATLGGLQGAFEPCLLLLVAVWIGLSLGTNRSHLRSRIDGRLLAASALLWAIVLFAPNRYMSTILFAQRWAPGAALLLLLALPMPRLQRLATALPIIALAAMLAVTCWTWRQFDAETTGLEQSLAAIHPPCRLLWLSFSSSELMKTHPFVQIGAYAQAIDGCELSFSFTEHRSEIVTLEGQRKITWTQGLEWLPEMARSSDTEQFDSILLEGPEEVHTQLPSVLQIRPLTNEGRFRLYTPK